MAAIDLIKDRRIKRIRLSGSSWCITGSLMEIDGKPAGAVDWFRSRFYNGDFWFIPISGSAYTVLDKHMNPSIPRPPVVNWGPASSTDLSEEDE